MKNICLIVIFIRVCLVSQATNYYFHPLIGNDDNTGTSQMQAFKSLEAIKKLNLLPKDKILLSAGQEFYGTIELNSVSGTYDQPIMITSYDWEGSPVSRKAHINAKGYLNGIAVLNCSHIIIENLEITANGSKTQQEGKMRCGVLVQATQSGHYENITFNNLDIHDVFFENEGFQRGKKEVRTANGTQAYGWGIRFINRVPSALIKNVVVSNCQVYNVAHTGIKFTGRGQSILNPHVFNNQVNKTGGPGIQMSGVRNGHIHHNWVNHSGSKDDSRKWGRGSGLWTWGSTNVLIENNRFTNANGPADSAGCHIDFNCSNIIVQYNFSANNAGGFCEILGNNYNCAYRYNISVNDGHRVKGKNGGFQEGKTFWLSGFAGKNRKRKGPFNSYFYNNTIYVKEAIFSKIAIDRAANGILIANNIFCIEGATKVVKGDQYKPETEGAWNVKEVFFKNNLFLTPNSWPKEQPLQDVQPQFGNPNFFNTGGENLVDYIPLNTILIKDKGINIPIINKDSIGITVGLHPKVDILGNAIIGLPDMGAIELE